MEWTMKSVSGIFRKKSQDSYNNLSEDDDLRSLEEPSIPSSSIYTSRDEDALHVFESSGTDNSNDESSADKKPMAQFDSFELPLSVTKREDSEVPSNPEESTSKTKLAPLAQSPYRNVYRVGILILLLLVIGAIVIPILVLSEHDDDDSAQPIEFPPTTRPPQASPIPTILPTTTQPTTTHPTNDAACLDTVDPFLWNGALRTCSFVLELTVAFRLIVCQETSVGGQQCPVSCGVCP